MSKNVAVAAARDEKKSRVDRILDSIERAGNALPHPFILFMILSGIILVLSLVMSRAGVSVTALSATNGGSETAETVFTIQNLVTKDYLLNLVINFLRPVKDRFGGDHQHRGGGAFRPVVRVCAPGSAGGLAHLDDAHYRLYRGQR